MIPPPRRPGYRERLIRVIPAAMKTASGVAPHGVVIGVVAEVRGELPSSKGVMPGKRRRIERAYERQPARSRWSKQLRDELQTDSQALDVLQQTRATQSPAEMCLSQHAARMKVLELLGRNPDILIELSGYAEDEAKANLAEFYLRPGKLVELAKGRNSRAGTIGVLRAAVRDMHGRPLESGRPPFVIQAAAEDVADTFSEITRREALRILEAQLDCLIASATSPVVPRLTP